MYKILEIGDGRIKKKLARWPVQIAQVASFYFLLFRLHFFKIYTYMHLFCFMAMVSFLHHMPCRDSTNLFL